MAINLPYLKDGIPKCQIEGCDGKMFVYLEGLWVCNDCFQKWHTKQAEQQKTVDELRQQRVRDLVNDFNNEGES